MLRQNGVERAPRLARGLHLSSAHSLLQRSGKWDHWLHLVYELSCVNNNSRISRRNALRFGFSDFAIEEKRWTNEMLRVPVYSGVLKQLLRADFWL